MSKQILLHNIHNNNVLFCLHCPCLFVIVLVILLLWTIHKCTHNAFSMSTEWQKNSERCLWTSTVANSQENLFFVDGSCRWQHRLKIGKQTVSSHPSSTFWAGSFKSELAKISELRIQKMC